MIVDCYTHTWETPGQLGRCLPAGTDSVSGGQTWASPEDAHPSRHFAASEPVDVTIVSGFVSRVLEADLSNDRIAEYVAEHPDRLIGFAGVDPSDPKEAIAELVRARDHLSMRGIAIAPPAQGFHPSNSQAMLVYAEAAERGMPVLFHSGVHMTSATQMEYAQPLLLDEVAREFPELRIIIAHMGDPFVHETVVLLGKHKHVYADISRLLHRPWQGYQSLLAAYESGVMDKLLFGSGFPSSSASDCIESLYSINHICQGTNLPAIPREHLRGIVERDALSLLGIGALPPAAAPLSSSTTLVDDGS